MDPNDKRFRFFAIAVVAALVLVALINFYQARNSQPGTKILSYSQFLDDVAQGEIHSVTLSGQSIGGVFTDHTMFRTYAADDPDLVKLLRQKAVAITAEPPAATGPSWLNVLTTLLPMILLVGVAILFMSRMPGMSGRAMGLGKSKAKLLAPAQGRVTFADVAGVDEAKDSLQEIVDFLRSPQTFQRLGGRIPHGVLLVGPPGTGKTLLVDGLRDALDPRSRR